MREVISTRKKEDRWISGNLVKKAILPSFCFAVLSTIAFEDTVHAAQANPTKVTIINQGTIKFVNISNGSLNLRSGASTSAPIIGSLKKGTEIIINSEKNGWAAVKVNGKNGYVSSLYLSASNPQATPSSTAKKNKTAATNATNKTKATFVQAASATMYVNVSSGTLNMRNGASTKASIIVQLVKGTSVKVYSQSGGWAKIEVYGHTGYVSSEYLTSSLPGTNKTAPVQQAVTKYVSVDSGSNLYLKKSASSNSAVLAKLANGTEVKVYSEANGWAKVKVNGFDGYVSSAFLSKTKKTDNITQQSITTKYVNVELGSSLNMRKSASNNASVLVKLARGIAVTVYSETGGWSKIKAYGQIGYVNSNYLSSAKPIAGINTTGNSNHTSTNQIPEKFVNVIYGSSLNMRSTASSNAAVITKLSRGTIVTVISESNGWTKVSANGLTGYVSSQYLSTTEPINPSTKSGSQTVTYDNYNISLSDMIKIQNVMVPQTDKKYDTYIRADALTLTGPLSGIVNGSGWNVRGGAGTEYWVIGQVDNQESLQILTKVKSKDGKDWYKIAYNNTWVNASPDDVAYYVNPKNFQQNKVDSLQFLKLSVSAKLNAVEVNSRILTGKGSLQGMASAFISAGNTFGVNEIYLISHALLETGNGTSQLANGVECNNKTVYNMYGIGAIDSDPIISGAKFAYNAGWFTPEAAIIGGAQFIANGYINAGQDTIYKMRWNPDGAVNGSAFHEYASDIGWAEKQVNQINNIYSLLDSYKLVFEIPQYK